MKVDVQTEIIIQRPLMEVADYAANPDNAPIWYKNIQSAIWKSEKPLRVGSKVAFVAKFMGKELAYTYEFVRLEPGKILVMRTAEGPFPMETTYTWEALGPNSTKMGLRNAGQPKGFSALFAPFMARMMRKANKADLEAIKQILEAR